MLTAQQTQLLMDSGSLINNMFGFQSNTNSTSENLMKALNEGNIRDLIPAMAGAVQTANNAASLGGIATPNTNHAALGAAALSLSINGYLHYMVEISSSSKSSSPPYNSTKVGI